MNQNFENLWKIFSTWITTTSRVGQKWKQFQSLLEKLQNYSEIFGKILCLGRCKNGQMTREKPLSIGKAKVTKNIYLGQAIQVDIQFNLSSAKYWEFIHQLWFCDMLGTYYVESAVICFVMKTKHSNMTSHTEGAKIWANCFQLQNKKSLVNLSELLNNALALFCFVLLFFFFFPTQNEWVNYISVHAHWRPIITTLLTTTSIFSAAKEKVWEQLLWKSFHTNKHT